MAVERSGVGWHLWLLWVLASAVGWAVSVALLVAPESVTLLGAPEVVGGIFGLVSMVGGGVGLGAIAGIALVWLLRQPVPEA